MLTLEIGHEVVREEGRKVRFETEVEFVLELEHSLASLSKWEQVWEKPFLDGKENTIEEMLSYIECMVVTKNPPKDWTLKLSQENLMAVNNYINKKMTATYFRDDQLKAKTSSEQITYELIEYWLSNLPSVPPDYKSWHLNSLFAFIKIHDVKNQKAPAANTQEAKANRRAEMERRRAQYAHGK